MNSKIFRERALLITCIMLGAFQAWICRYEISGDGISYLDVGDAFFRRDWSQAINGYWSPFYCWCLGLALNLVKPALGWEFITVHLVNWIIYLAALFSFRLLMHAMIKSLRHEGGDGTASAGDSHPLPESILLILGYGIFLWASLILASVGEVTPDLLVAAIVFLMAAYLVELRHDESYAKFASFGVLSGLAYLAKAVMFPLGFFMLGILLVSARITKRRLAGVMLAGALFIAVSAPFIAALSKQKGRFTFGDSGRIAYAGMVSPGIPPTHWQGEEPGSGVPKHPTRQMMRDPPVFEFASPVGGTFPPWDDPSYWEDGAKGVFQWRSQIRVLIQSARNYTAMLIGELGLLAGIAIFMLWGGALRRREILSYWPLIVAALAALGLYSLVLVRTRYIGASVVFLFIAILAGIRLPRNADSQLTKYVSVAVLATILFSVTASLAEAFYLTITVYGLPTANDQTQTAEGLLAMGLRAGDQVAVIDDGRRDFWARLAGFRIVAEVFAPDAQKLQFWSEPQERKELAYDCLRRAGARVVVVWAPPHNMDPGWRQISPTSHYYARFLDR